MAAADVIKPVPMQPAIDQLAIMDRNAAGITDYIRNNKNVLYPGTWIVFVDGEFFRLILPTDPPTTLPAVHKILPERVRGRYTARLFDPDATTPETAASFDQLPVGFLERPYISKNMPVDDDGNVRIPILRLGGSKVVEKSDDPLPTSAFAFHPKMAERAITNQFMDRVRRSAAIASGVLTGNQSESAATAIDRKSMNRKLSASKAVVVRSGRPVEFRNVQIRPKKGGAWLTGLNGTTARQGVFAAKDLDAWTEVLKEKPVGITGSPADAGSLAEQLLSVKGLNETWTTMRGMAYDAKADLKSQTTASFGLLKRLIGTYEDGPAKKAWNIASRVPPMVGKRQTFFSRSVVQNALFETALLLNHDCRPNCVLICTPTVAHLFAVQPINAGDELTISYLPDSRLMDLNSRTSVLADQYGIRCACRKCTADRVYSIPDADFGFAADIEPIPISLLVLSPEMLSIRVFCMTVSRLIDIGLRRDAANDSGLENFRSRLAVEMDMTPKDVCAWFYRWLPVYIQELVDRSDGGGLLRVRDFIMFFRLSIPEAYNFDAVVQTPLNDGLRLIWPTNNVISNILLLSTETPPATKDLSSRGLTAIQFSSIINGSAQSDIAVR